MHGFPLASKERLEGRDRRSTLAHIATAHGGEFGVLFTHDTEACDCELTFGVFDDTDGIFADPGDFATQIWSAVTAHLVPIASPHVVFDGITFEDRRTLPFSGADYPQTATPGTHTGATTIVPTDTALAVKRSSGELGRSARGRVYWPLWASELLLTADKTSSTVASQVTSALVAFQAAVEGGTLPCLVGHISTQHGGAARTAGVFYRTVAWGASDLVIDTQRRRLLGRGR